MKTFKYSACDTTGSRKEGLTQANSANDVIGWLRERGLTPISIQEIVEAVKHVAQKTEKKENQVRRNRGSLLAVDDDGRGRYSNYHRD